VNLTVQAQASSASIVFVPIGDGVFVPSVGGGSGDGADVRGSDAVALEEGFITVTPITSDMAAAPGERGRLNSVVAGFGVWRGPRRVAGCVTRASGGGGERARATTSAARRHGFGTQKGLVCPAKPGLDQRLGAPAGPTRSGPGPAGPR